MSKIWLQTGLLVLALLLPAARAQAQDLPYASFELAQFPDAAWEVPGERAGSLLPDYDSSLLETASYSERPGHGELPEAVLTVEVARECRLSLIYYSPAGAAYLVRTSLPVLPRSTLTSTFELPAGESSGLTRLLLWEAGFEQSWLAFLARHPLQEMEPVPGLLSQAWFGRERPQSSRYPWEDPYRPVSGLRAGSLRSTEPLCMARLDSDGWVASKDCAVRSSAPVRLQSDEYGILGMWELDWSSRLRINLELPPGDEPSAAYLVVYGSSGRAFGVASNPAFEVSVNGWTVSPSLHVSPFEVSLQPVMLDVSQYLDEGANEISLQLSALADKMWKVSRIELWTE